MSLTYRRNLKQKIKEIYNEEENLFQSMYKKVQLTDFEKTKWFKENCEVGKFRGK